MASQIVDPTVEPAEDELIVEDEAFVPALLQDC
jgi:hypothetical protein